MTGSVLLNAKKKTAQLEFITAVLRVTFLGPNFLQSIAHLWRRCCAIPHIFDWVVSLD